MNIDSRVKAIIKNANNISKCALKEPEYVKKYYASTEIKRIVETDFMSKNPRNIAEEYISYFANKSLPTRIIHRSEEFYRARIGYKTETGADDDLDKTFMLPYYGTDIMTPPPLLSSGARFNKAGTSYLYLSDEIETCMAEVHLQVGQLCSIGKFRCKQDMEVIDLTAIKNDLEMEVWLEILTQPVYGDNKNRYNITNFISDILTQFNDNGLWFKSTQSKGNNIVCYKPEMFELVQFSEKLFRTKEISYTPVCVEDSIDEFTRREHFHLSSYNLKEDEAREKTIDYMEDWIEFRKKQEE